VLTWLPGRSQITQSMLAGDTVWLVDAAGAVLDHAIVEGDATTRVIRVSCLAFAPETPRDTAPFEDESPAPPDAGLKAPRGARLIATVDRRRRAGLARPAYPSAPRSHRVASSSGNWGSSAMEQAGHLVRVDDRGEHHQPAATAVRAVRDAVQGRTPQGPAS
jgi:hypothetical protein